MAIDELSSTTTTARIGKKKRKKEVNTQSLSIPRPPPRLVRFCIHSTQNENGKKKLSKYHRIYLAVKDNWGARLENQVRRTNFAE